MKLDVVAICERIGEDSLGYLNLAGLETAVNQHNPHPTSYCTACFFGQYLVLILEWLFLEDRGKDGFENVLG